MAEAIKINDAHRWIMGYLAVEALKRGPYSSISTYVTAESLVHMLPVTLLRENKLETTGAIVQVLVDLYNVGALQLSRYGDIYEQDTAFVITADGILAFRLYLQPLVQAIDSTGYKKVIEQTKGDDKIKKEMQQLQTKLKDKAENEIIDGFMGLAKQYGSQVVIYLIKLANEYAKSAST